MIKSFLPTCQRISSSLFIQQTQLLHLSSTSLKLCAVMFSYFFYQYVGHDGCGWSHGANWLLASITMFLISFTLWWEKFGLSNSKVGSICFDCKLLFENQEWVVIFFIEILCRILLSKCKNYITLKRSSIIQRLIIIVKQRDILQLFKMFLI